MSNPKWDNPIDLDEKKDYYLDWRPMLVPRGDIILSCQWGLTAQATAAGVMIMGQQFTELDATVFLAMQAPRKTGTYGIACTIITSGERVYQQVRMLQVVDNGYQGGIIIE